MERLAANALGTAAALLESARDNDGEATFDVTPLRTAGAIVGYLAIERLSPARLVLLKEQRVSSAARRWSLTRRQAQVLSLVAEGAANARIAAHLGISERTAEDHVAAILGRACAATRSELIAALLGDFA
ncbi:MAG: LuxR family transcriptional regulator [Myxococcales bacterium]|nr:MAG: LuxR family transcriptional regulator [Myxococcales bacterium]